MPMSPTKDKKEGISIDELAQMVASGFTELQQEMRQEIREFREEVRTNFTEVDDRLRTLEKGRLEDTRRFDAFEQKVDRKLTGIQESLDNTVTRAEHAALVLRVDQLERVCVV